MAENGIELYFIVESWLTEEDTYIIGGLQNNYRYRLINMPRFNRSGGGICCLLRSSLKVLRKETVTRAIMEVLETTFEVQDRKLTTWPNVPREYIKFSLSDLSTCKRQHQKEKNYETTSVYVLYCDATCSINC